MTLRGTAGTPVGTPFIQFSKFQFYAQLGPDDEDLNALSYMWQTYCPLVLRDWKQQLL